MRCGSLFLISSSSSSSSSKKARRVPTARLDLSSPYLSGRLQNAPDICRNLSGLAQLIEVIDGFPFALRIDEVSVRRMFDEVYVRIFSRMMNKLI
jgi:hypothetical protein